MLANHVHLKRRIIMYIINYARSEKKKNSDFVKYIIIFFRSKKDD